MKIIICGFILVIIFLIANRFSIGMAVDRAIQETKGLRDDLNLFSKGLDNIMETLNVVDNELTKLNAGIDKMLNELEESPHES